MAELLFIYGTLHPDRAPREISAAARRLVPLGHATLHARLLDLGEYPGVILDNSVPPIAGDLFAIPDVETLTALDAYEDFRPNDLLNSLFVREKAVATLQDGCEKSCWVYVWNGERPDQLEWGSKRGDCCSGE